MTDERKRSFLAEANADIPCGIFAPKRARKILFTQPIRFRVSDLRYRKSRVTITGRMRDGKETESE